MRALTVEPHRPNTARLEEFPEPPLSDGDVLVQTLAIGVCGTDREIVAGGYGWAPPGEKRLVIGHESLGRVLQAPPTSALKAGDFVVGIVRRPDPVPCAYCAAGEFDMCSNGRYTERGIKERHGYASERYRIGPSWAVKVDPSLGELGVLLEPASVLAKAWDHTEKIGGRAHWAPKRMLVTGAGPIGLLAALMGRQRGLDVHVVDRSESGPKPELVRALGATYHPGPVRELDRDWDVIFECTGASELIADVLHAAARDGIVCLTGVSTGGRVLPVDMGALNRDLVLENNVVFGSVNANLRHYESGARALAEADPGWLERLVTRRVPIDRWEEALARRPGDVKVILTFP